jgi:hypothetical protein
MKIEEDRVLNCNLEFVIFQADNFFEYASILSSEIEPSRTSPHVFAEKSHLRCHRNERLVATAIDS